MQARSLRACFKHDAIDSDVDVEESEFDSTLIVTDQEYKCVEVVDLLQISKAEFRKKGRPAMRG